MNKPSFPFRAVAALFLLVQTSACGVLDDLSAAVEAQAEAARELFAEMEGPLLALGERYPEYSPQVTVRTAGDLRTFEVHLTTRNANSPPEGEALSALIDEAMAVALEALPDRTAFDEATVVFTVERTAAVGPFSGSARTSTRAQHSIIEWEERLGLAG